jgi:hypothetical protein
MVNDMRAPVRSTYFGDTPSAKSDGFVVAQLSDKLINVTLRHASKNTTNNLSFGVIADAYAYPASSTFI